jgi:hypothetical protein
MTADESMPEQRFWYEDFRVHRATGSTDALQVDDAHMKQPIATIKILSNGTFCLWRDDRHHGDHQNLKDTLLALRGHLAAGGA